MIDFDNPEHFFANLDTATGSQYVPPVPAAPECGCKQREQIKRFTNVLTALAAGLLVIFLLKKIFQ